MHLARDARYRLLLLIEQQALEVYGDALKAPEVPLFAAIRGLVHRQCDQCPRAR